MKIMLIIFLVILSGALYINADEAINSEAQLAYEKTMAHTRKQSKAYEYLLGIKVPVGVSPENAGISKLEILRKYEASYSLQSAVATLYDKEEVLPIFKLNSCKGCSRVERLYAQKFSFKKLSDTNRALLRRYKKFLSFNDWYDLSVPHELSPIPYVNYLLSANDLMSLQLIEFAKQGNAHKAIDDLLEHINVLRQHLISADGFVLKIGYLALISKNINLLSSLVHHFEVPFERKLSPLNLQERSFELAINREYVGMYHLYKSIGNDIQLFSNIGSAKNIEAWTNWFLFKPNMSINDAYEKSKRNIKKSLLVRKGLSQQKINDDEISSSSFKNRVGDALNSIQIDYDNRYFSWVHDLDVKIELFNKTAHQRKTLKSLLPLVKSSFEKAYLNKRKTAICIGEIEYDTHAYRKCLVLN